MTTLNEGDALYLGGEAVDEVYLGTEKVWPSFAVSDDFNRPDDPSGLGPNYRTIDSFNAKPL